MARREDGWDDFLDDLESRTDIGFSTTYGWHTSCPTGRRLARALLSRDRGSRAGLTRMGRGRRRRGMTGTCGLSSVE